MTSRDEENAEALNILRDLAKAGADLRASLHGSGDAPLNPHEQQEMEILGAAERLGYAPTDEQVKRIGERLDDGPDDEEEEDEGSRAEVNARYAAMSIAERMEYLGAMRTDEMTAAIKWVMEHSDAQ